MAQSNKTLYAALALVASFTTLYGCAHRHGQVGMKRLEVTASLGAEESRQEQRKSNELFAPAYVIGAEVQTKPPEYPVSLLKEKLQPMNICVDIIVDVQGTASEIKPLTQAKCTPPTTPSYGPFFEAVSGTIRQWRFEPALICVFPPSMTPRESLCRAKNAAELGIDVKKIPVILSYQFEFLQVDGKAVVRKQ